MVLLKLYKKFRNSLGKEDKTIDTYLNYITLLEIQESSKLTYRVNDFNRIHINGNERELYTSKAMDVLNFSKLDIHN